MLLCIGVLGTIDDVDERPGVGDLAAMMEGYLKVSAMQKVRGARCVLEPAWLCVCNVARSIPGPDCLPGTPATISG